MARPSRVYARDSRPTELAMQPAIPCRLQTAHYRLTVGSRPRTAAADEQHGGGDRLGSADWNISHGASLPVDRPAGSLRFRQIYASTRRVPDNDDTQRYSLSENSESAASRGDYCRGLSPFPTPFFHDFALTRCHNDSQATLSIATYHNSLHDYD